MEDNLTIFDCGFDYLMDIHELHSSSSDSSRKRL